MDKPPGESPALNPIVRDFILYCIEHHDCRFHSLYDTMCWVASHRLFKGMGYQGLREVGLSLGLEGIEETYKMVDAVLSQRQNPLEP